MPKPKPKLTLSQQALATLIKLEKATDIQNEEPSLWAEHVKAVLDLALAYSNLLEALA